MNVKCNIDSNKIKNRLGIEPNGRVQSILDNKLVDYLREYEPVDSSALQMSTRKERPGLVVVASKYAHYQNEGEVYVDPVTKKGAFYNPITGRYWSRPGVKKIPSGRRFTTYGATRGPHFVERTLNEKTENILRDIKEGMKK